LTVRRRPLQARKARLNRVNRVPDQAKRYEAPADAVIS